MLEYTWDPEKEATNVRKRGITFDEAKSVFKDPGRLEMADITHSEDEPRQLTIGWSDRARLLVVISSECDPEGPRIISARRASKRERHDYARRR